MSPPSTFSSAATPTSLSITTIILYTLLILPTFYIWRRHGKPGFLAYNFIYAFCATRITGSALSIVAVHDTSLETAAAIVNSIAISPLMLAALGVLHEARNARIASLDSRREWMAVGGVHAIVTTGMVLVVIGIVNVVEGVSTTADSGLIKAGLAVLVLAYVVLLIWTSISLGCPFRPRSEPFNDGTVVSYPLPIWRLSLLSLSSCCIPLLLLCLSSVCDLFMELYRSYSSILRLRNLWQRKSFWALFRSWSLLLCLCMGDTGLAICTLTVVERSWAKHRF
jgi:hypothetical protein